MTIYEFLNQKPNQYLQISDDRFYAYGGILLNCESGEVITLNDEETLAKQRKVTKFPFKIRNKNGNIIYYEDSEGKWNKKEFDADGNKTFWLTHTGEWEKMEYRSPLEVTYLEKSDGYWSKWEYDANGNQTRFEKSDGFWSSCEFDDQDNVIYMENSRGEVRDNRPKQ
jgi:hypothetical protein